MIRRLNGSVRLAAHPHGVFHGHVLGTKDAAHQLHQHQRNAPGGQQRLQRTAVEETQHATLQHRAHQGRSHEGHRHSRQQVPVKKIGQIAAEYALHHKGGIGANHHQLAVGHVDHTHQAVGDGQPQRHQQQDGAQTHAGESNPKALAPGQLVFYFSQRTLEGCLDLVILLAG